MRERYLLNILQSLGTPTRQQSSSNRACTGRAAADSNCSIVNLQTISDELCFSQYSDRLQYDVHTQEPLLRIYFYGARTEIREAWRHSYITHAALPCHCLRKTSDLLTPVSDI